MMRLIDADALRESLFESSQFDTYNDYSMVLDRIDLSPTIEEQKKGRWISNIIGVVCSNCGYKLETTGLLSYCPHCGIEMEGKE